MEARKFEDLAKTPPMGWNSWNKFHCDVSEALIIQAADALISSGMKDAGYEYIVIDDSWSEVRCRLHRLQVALRECRELPGCRVVRVVRLHLVPREHLLHTLKETSMYVDMPPHSVKVYRFIRK
jgi:hypothetical protein